MGPTCSQLDLGLMIVRIASMCGVTVCGGRHLGGGSSALETLPPPGRTTSTRRCGDLQGVTAGSREGLRRRERRY
jgi:hypothetical protein